MGLTPEQSRLLRRHFFLTPSKHRDLERRFSRDMRALHQQLDDRRPRNAAPPVALADVLATLEAAAGQPVDPFVEGLVVQLVAILERYQSVFDWRRRPVRLGRPPGLDYEQAARRFGLRWSPNKGKGGAPVKFTLENKQWFLAEIAAWEARFAARRIKCFQSDALRVSIAAHRFKDRQAHRLLDEETRLAEWVTAITRLQARAVGKRDRTVTVAQALHARICKLFEDEHVASGLTRDEARPLARAKAQELSRSPLFSTRKTQLSRLRSRARHDARR